MFGFCVTAPNLRAVETLALLKMGTLPVSLVIEVLDMTDVYVAFGKLLL